MSKKEKVLMISIITLVIYSIISYNKIAMLESRLHALDGMQHDLAHMNDSVQIVSSEVQLKLDEFIQEQRWISSKGYQITEANLQKNTVDVLMEWAFRDLRDDEKVTLLYRGEEEDEWTELEVTSHNGLNYSVSYAFPLRDNYQTQIIAQSESSIRSEPLVDLQFKDMLDTRVSTNVHIHHGGRKDFDIHIDIFNPLKSEFWLEKGETMFRLKSAKAYLLINGEEVKEYDLLAQQNHYQADRYSENLFFHEYLTLETELEEEVEDVELRVIVEDAFGLTYETSAHPMH